MKEEAITRPRKLILALLVIIITMLIRTCQAHTCQLPNSPSPSPANGVAIAEVPKKSKGVTEKATRRGSFPAKCNSKCNDCEPCMPVQVSIRTTALEENEYYPQVWKCMCGQNLFSP